MSSCMFLVNYFICSGVLDNLYIKSGYQKPRKEAGNISVKCFRPQDGTEVPEPMSKARELETGRPLGLTGQLAYLK